MTYLFDKKPAKNISHMPFNSTLVINNKRPMLLADNLLLNDLHKASFSTTLSLKNKVKKDKSNSLKLKDIVLKSIKKTFTVINIVTVLISLCIGWLIKIYIITQFNLDVSEFLEFLYAMLPSALGVKLARAILEQYPIEVYLSATNQGNQTFNQGNQPVARPPVRGSIQDIQARQAQADLDWERKKALERIESRTQAHNALAQFAGGSSPDDVNIVDPTQIGVRGYIPGGIHQPFARNIADELENQGVVGVFTRPTVDPNARRFLAAVLPQFRPDVYANNSTISQNVPFISKADIAKLRSMR